MRLYRLESGCWVFTTTWLGGMIHVGQYSLWRLLRHLPVVMVLHFRKVIGI